VYELAGQDLERHLASKVDVDGAVNDAHTPPADLLDDLVMGKPPADHRDTSLIGARIG
jgi:hypothetical protein